MTQSAASDTTAALMELLVQWPRQAVQAAIDASASPVDEIVSGELARTLTDLQSARPRRQTKQNYAHNVQGYTHGSHERVVGYFDEAFPARLREIADPPLVLFYLGELAVLEAPTVAVVGARQASNSGADFARALAEDLAAAGCCVVSGLAAGIDGAAHRGALRTGCTAAFLGHGLAAVYPSWHRALAQSIVEHAGLLASEYAYGTPPRAFRFPERNRLISGASMIVVVVEASEKSGSLITARLAAEQGRDVLAVPGPPQSGVSAGCHRLIRDGAGLVTCAQHVLEELGMEAIPTGPAPLLDGQAAAIYAGLEQTPRMAEEVAADLALPFAEVVSVLVELELRGIVRQQGLGYIRTSSHDQE